LPMELGNGQKVPSKLVIDPHHFGLSGNPVEVNVTSRNEFTCQLSTDEFALTLTAGNGSPISICIADLGEWLEDTIASKLLVCDPAEAMLVKTSSSGAVWICLVRGGGSQWHAEAIEVATPPVARSGDTPYAIFRTGQQHQNLFESHQALIDLLGSVFLTLACPTRASVLLRVKVDKDQLWFLRFPLGAFAVLKLKGFAHYYACQWIVTERWISEIARAQAETELEIADPATFFSGAHIVINTYADNSKDAGWIESARCFVLELLELFRDVEIQGTIMTLRWTLNPRPDLLGEILLSPRTRFLFADFEAGTGIWQTGDGPHRCCVDCNHELSGRAPAAFDLKQFKDRLCHIRLLRIFHCNSIYSPSRWKEQPASKNTLARQLLDTGAYFVEGSVSEEPVSYFYCNLLQFLLTRSDLRTILWAKGISGQLNNDELLARANSLMSQKGWPHIE